MTYRELIELYKNNQLEGEQKEKVKKDIERQEAIGEYLFEMEDIPGLEELKGDISECKTMESDFLEKEDEDARKFMKMIRSSIRKAFLKMGVVVVLIILLIVGFVTFKLPDIITNQYYNPDEIVGKEEGGYTTNRITLDMATYTELFLPGYYRYDVNVQERGYGEYDIEIMQNSSYTGEFTNVSGEIEKGDMRLYDSNTLRKPSSNVFVKSLAGVDDYFEEYSGPAGDYSEAIEELNNLNAQDYYIAYVTLDKVMSYGELSEWSKVNKVYPEWCAVCEKREEGYFMDRNIGFLYSSSASKIFYDNKEYPYLSYFDTISTIGKENDWVVPEDVMKQHMLSMLRYMSNQDDFCEMIDYGDEKDYFQKLADNIESNGLNIYGFVTIIKKDELIELSQKEHIAYIYTERLK